MKIYKTKCNNYIVGYSINNNFNYCVTESLYIYLTFMTNKHIIKIPELENHNIALSLDYKTKNYIIINHLLMLNQFKIINN